MPRRQLPESTDNHERWLISYADFITLLFAVFVVMYSTASSKGNRYENFRFLSDSIIAALADPNVSLSPIDDGQLRDAVIDMITTRRTVPEVPLVVPLTENAVASWRNAGEAAEFEVLSRSVKDAVSSLLEDGKVESKPAQRRVEVALPSRLLFPSGSRVLLADAVPVLESLASILRKIPNEIRVEAYTDNLPVRTGLFDSNWELSSAQATAVLRELEAEGLDPARLSATGFGEHRPMADNSSEEGRTANRRVVLVIQPLPSGEE